MKTIIALHNLTFIGDSKFQQNLSICFSDIQLIKKWTVNKSKQVLECL